MLGYKTKRPECIVAGGSEHFMLLPALHFCTAFVLGTLTFVTFVTLVTYWNQQLTHSTRP